MSEHTPGPWRIEHTGIPPSDWDIVVTVGDDPWRFVASVHGDPESGGMPGPEADRNAHLISAAPDLLAACEAALGVLGQVGGYHRAQTQLQDAIAKARGETADMRRF